MPSSPKTLAGKRRAIMNGTYSGTSLKASDLKENRNGKIVSKKASASSKRQYKASSPKKGLKGWAKACKKAEAELGYWPVPITKGSQFYKTAKKHFSNIKATPKKSK